ncbi:MFS transporter [Acetobacter sp. DsW_059]|uniref:MFS transporter n=1 Tax=Acetobacter sp. DsW_059 TaxID=1670661 RepID=UPI001E37F40F|nr:MFS transporter [Acetobacter sp. DsW_059]
MTRTSPSAADLPVWQRRTVMTCALLGLVLAGIDAAIANIALPTIATDLNTGVGPVTWIVNGYQITAAIFLLPAAALGETRGLRAVYAFGLGLFTLASLACALSSTLPLLLLSRVAQGAGSAFMAALSGAIVRKITPPPLLHRAFTAVALCVALSAAVGPTLASAILSVASWPWLFLVNLPIGIVTVSLYLYAAPRHQKQAQTPRFDWTGALFNAGALGLGVLAVDALSAGAHKLAELEAALCIASTIALIYHQRKQPHPLLPLDLLRIPLFALSIAASVCAYAAQIMAYVSLPFFFENFFHYSPVMTGLLVTPWPLLVACAAPVSGHLASRHPASLLSSVGLVLLACGIGSLAMMPANPGLADILPRMAICGIGFGFYQTPNNLTVMTAGPVHRSGAASGMMAVARTMGWSLGSALVALIFDFDKASPDGGTRTCLWVAMGIALLGATVSVARRSVRKASH